MSAAVLDGSEVVWSVEMTVKHRGYWNVGAAGPELFSNEAGSPHVVWLWCSKRNRELDLAFTGPVADPEESPLRLDDVSLPFQVESSVTAFAFTDVDISSTEGQVVAVNIVQ